jgi:hypothetical protein
MMQRIFQPGSCFHLSFSSNLRINRLFNSLQLTCPAGPLFQAIPHTCGIARASVAGLAFDYETTLRKDEQIWVRPSLQKDLD